MQNQHIIQQISMAIAAALIADLPAVPYRAWTPGLKKLLVPPDEAPLKLRRPTETEIDVVSFPQLWGSTALGHGGMGGAAMTTAQTTVVMMKSPAAAAVYFGARLAYVVLEPNDRFNEDLRTRSMAHRRDAAAYGGIDSGTPASSSDNETGE